MAGIDMSNMDYFLQIPYKEERLPYKGVPAIHPAAEKGSSRKLSFPRVKSSGGLILMRGLYSDQLPLGGSVGSPNDLA
jgi:hypothetical protein